MSRYLTPSKVGLLVLGSLYVEGVAPASETVPLLSFLITHILPNAAHPPTVPPGETNHAVPVSEIESSLALLKTAIPGRTVWDLFVQKMWSINCADALDSFLSNITLLLAKPREQLLRERERGEQVPGHNGRVLRTSPLGAFIRRAHLEYARLQFHDQAALWQKFVAYRLPTREAWEKKNAPTGLSALDVNLSDMGIDTSHQLARVMYADLASEGMGDQGVSSFDVERLVEFQVSELQSKSAALFRYASSLSPGLGGRLPEKIALKLKHMAHSGAAMPAVAHYLRYLDSWRAGDYPSALDNLHRYFDFSMQHSDRTVYQYALLNLAILQADYGCHREAIPALQEAISVARENKDVVCLNFCMGWLYHFGKSFPQEMKEIRKNGILGSEDEGLAFLKSRAKDADMWTLLCTTLLSEARFGLQNVTLLL